MTNLRQDWLFSHHSIPFLGRNWSFSHRRKHSYGRKNAPSNRSIPFLGQNWSCSRRDMSFSGQEWSCSRRDIPFSGTNWSSSHSRHTLSCPRMVMLRSLKAFFRSTECFIRLQHALSWPGLVIRPSKNTLSWPRSVMGIFEVRNFASKAPFSQSIDLIHSLHRATGSLIQVLARHGVKQSYTGV